MVNDPFAHVREERTPDVLEKFAQEGKAQTSGKSKAKKPRLTIPGIARSLKYCVENPEVDCGLPCVTDVVQKLREYRTQHQENLFNLSLTVPALIDAFAKKVDPPL